MHREKILANRLLQGLVGKYLANLDLRVLVGIILTKLMAGDSPRRIIALYGRP